MQELQKQYQQYQQANLQLDLTRGKPAPEQLVLSNELDSILNGNFKTADGMDVRNYGGLEGIPEARALGGHLLEVDPANVIVGGNSSLSLMHLYVCFACYWGAQGHESAWSNESAVKFLCPSPGYDRHFTVCENLGIEMIPVSMTDQGPDMDQVEELLANDPQIKGIWCVPKYSNPTGCVYSDETVERLANLKMAGPHFRILWDNAYAVHDLASPAPALKNIMTLCQQNGTEDQLVMFGSTSKITFAGSGISFLATSTKNLQYLQKQQATMTIGPDKINQLRHARFLKDRQGLEAHMKKHAAIIQPKFDVVLKTLEKELGGTGLGTWTQPQGGYFISFDTKPGCAKKVVQLAKEAGVKLTPAGATFPYGNDPQDTNIRLAPTFPPVEEVQKAMDVFVTCVKLASL